MVLRKNVRKRLQREEEERCKQFPTRLLPQDVVKNILHDHYALNLGQFLKTFMDGAFWYNDADLKSMDKSTLMFEYLKEMYCCWGHGEARKVELLVTRLVIDAYIRHETLYHLGGLREIYFEETNTYSLSRQFLAACRSSLRALKGCAPNEYALGVLTDFQFPHLHTLHFDYSEDAQKPEAMQELVSYFPSKITSLRVPYDISDCFPQLQRLIYLDGPVDINAAATHLTQLTYLSTFNIAMLSTPFDSLKTFIHHTALSKSVLNSIFSNCINLTRIKCVLGLPHPDSYVGSGQLVEATFSIPKRGYLGEIEHDPSLQQFTSSLINSNKNLRAFKCTLICDDALISELKPNRIERLEGFQFMIEEEWEKLATVFPDVCYLTASDTSSKSLSKVLQALPSINTLGLHTTERHHSLFSYIRPLKENGENISSLEIDMQELVEDSQRKSLGLLLSELPQVTSLTITGSFASVKNFGEIQNHSLKQFHLLSSVYSLSAPVIVATKKLNIESTWIYQVRRYQLQRNLDCIIDRIQDSRPQRIV